MSAARHPTEEPHYYNSAAYLAEVEARKAAANAKATYGYTARLRGDTRDAFKAHLLSQKAKTPHKEYLDTQTVERATERRMELERNATFNKLSASLPEPIRKQFKPGEDKPKTIDGMPHLASTVLGRMLHVAPDGSRSLIHVCMANFTPGRIDPRHHRFEEIPAQYDGVKNRPVTYLVGQKINPDGTLGDVDPRFTTKDGKAQMTHNLGEVRAALMKIGTANLTVMKQRQQKQPETVQIQDQSERDAIRARQAAARQQTKAPRQDASDGYEPRAYR